MQKRISLLVVLALFMACGAQHKNVEDEEALADSEVSVTSEVLTLPTNIAIDFPLALNSVNDDTFVQKIQNIKEIIEIEKNQLKLLEDIIEDIQEKCQGLITCHIEANSTIPLGEIDFTQDALSENYQYELSLQMSLKEVIIFKWSDSQKNVISIYKKDNYQLSMHYFQDVSKKKEVLYVDATQSSDKNSFMISLDNNSSFYRLRSNHVSMVQSSSFNILVQNEILLEENENIYSLNNDFSNVEEGTYIIFPSIESIEQLNLLERFEKSLGSFLLVDNKVQGFMYFESVVDEAVIPVRITALD